MRRKTYAEDIEKWDRNLDEAITIEKWVSREVKGWSLLFFTISTLVLFFYCYLTVVISLQGIFVLFIISKLGYEKREDIYFYDNKIFNYSKGNYRFVT